MKTLTIIFMTLGLICASQQPSGNSESIQLKSKNRYPLDFGTIQYKVEGKDVSGTATTYFDRKGWRSKDVKDLTISRYGLKTVEAKTELIDGDYIYQVNNTNSTGKQSSNNKWSTLLRYKSFDESSKAIYESQGAVLAGADTILNIPCNKWTYTNGTTSAFWEWKGLVLKTHKKMPGLEYTIQAISIDSTTVLKESIFDLADNIAWGN